MDYEAAYKILFNAITEAIDVLHKAAPATHETYQSVRMLENAQMKTEALYILSK